LRLQGDMSGLNISVIRTRPKNTNETSRNCGVNIENLTLMNDLFTTLYFNLDKKEF